MIKSDTVLILGAGASMDYGFPSGKDLIEDIINYLHGNISSMFPLKKKFCVALALQKYCEMELQDNRTLYDCYVKVENFQRALRYASPASIDDFIHKNREDGFDVIGKICIALSISSYEKENEDFFTMQVSTGQNHRYFDKLPRLLKEHLEIRDGWYQYLWKKIYEGCDNIEDSLRRLLFITFNYDRSLEYFLYTRLINMMGMSPDKTSEVFRKSVFIYHVYGQIGYLKWQGNNVYENPYQPLKLERLFEHIPIGFAPEDIEKQSDQIISKLESKDSDCVVQVLSLAKGIRTYTETSIPTEQNFPLRLLHPKNIFFLGFGYHPQNLEWLRNLLVDTNGTLYGTTYGCGKHEAIKITCKLHEVFPSATLRQEPFLTSSQYKIKEYFSHVMDIV